jgi:nucleoid-associated protein YgaU
MGSMQQAVLEFDEAVFAPWRPRLQADEVVDRPRLRALPSPTPARSSRVGVLAPSSGDPAVAEPGSAGERSGPRAPRPVPRAPVRRPSTGRSAPAPGRRPAVDGPQRGARRPACRPAPAGRIRLTVRGRALLTVLALAFGVVLVAVVGAVVDREPGLSLAGESSVVVRPGDTVWDIAVAVGGDDDVRAVVDEIQRLNGLDGSALVPGQRLRLP